MITMDQIKKEIQAKLTSAKTLEELNNLKVEYLGKKGIITELNSKIKEIPNEEKKAYGMKVNELRTLFNDLYNQSKENIELEEVNRRLESEAIDVTLPATKIEVGAPHSLEKLIEELEELLMSMGYDVVEGPEVEKDLYNFELLNLPKGHPARDAQDTFYIQDDEILLRSQTSPVQVRTMLENTDKTPIRIICPGKTYRRDEDDATHSHQFTQMEGLLVDENISLANLKATFDVIAKKSLLKTR